MLVHMGKLMIDNADETLGQLGLGHVRGVDVQRQCQHSLTRIVVALDGGVLDHLRWVGPARRFEGVTQYNLELRWCTQCTQASHHLLDRSLPGLQKVLIFGDGFLIGLALCLTLGIRLVQFVRILLGLSLVPECLDR